jgi:hypothetical protein
MPMQGASPLPLPHICHHQAIEGPRHLEIRQKRSEGQGGLGAGDHGGQGLGSVFSKSLINGQNGIRGGQIDRSFDAGG